ncbi:hypothetical protein FGRMN_93 [Fusarium graminum]|nr:hypothetical protein FGRMN_93 [Fusarium graminum]
MSVVSKADPNAGNCSLGLDLVTTPPSRKSRDNTHKDANRPTENMRAVLEGNPEGCLGTSVLESHPLDLDTAPCVVVIDPDTLKESDRATATLFEQYERDIADDGEKEQYAEFYLDRIWAKRRDFWLEKLHAMRG